MNTKRDKFLTEAMGGCWHEVDEKYGYREFPPYQCLKCKESRIYENMTFSTWQGFGKLWEWAIDQEWFVRRFGGAVLIHRFVNPNRFATAVYEYLKENQCQT